MSEAVADDYMVRLHDTMSAGPVQVASCRACGKEAFGYRVWPADGDRDTIRAAITALDANRAGRRMPLYLFAITRPAGWRGYDGSEPCEAWDTAAERAAAAGTFLECIASVSETRLCSCDFLAGDAR